MKEGKKSVDKDVNTALIKKAIGYDTKEIVEEYALDDDGEIKLSKKKVTIKSVPPDVSALKMLLERAEPLSAYTDEELEAEKERLIKMLGQTEKKKKEKTNCKKETKR